MPRKKELSDFSITDRYGDWRIFEFNCYLILTDIEKYLLDKNLKSIQLSSIAWKGMNLPLSSRNYNCICCGGKRYNDVDLSIPGIVVKNLNNKFNKLYTCIDGKHRIEKLIELNQVESYFYVIDYDIIKKYLFKFDRNLLKTVPVFSEG